LREPKIILVKAEYVFPALRDSLSRTVVPSVEHDLCNETRMRSADDSNEVDTKIEVKEMHTEEEDGLIARSFSAITAEPEISTHALSVHHGLCSEDCVQSSDDSKEFISIKIEEEEMR